MRSASLAAALLRAITESDVRDVLPAIRVPTLVLHRADDAVPLAHGRYLAGLIPGARFVELPGSDHLPMAGDIEVIVDEIQEFLTGVRWARTSADSRCTSALGSRRSRAPRRCSSRGR